MNVIKAYLANMYQTNRVHQFVDETEDCRKITHLDRCGDVQTLPMSLAAIAVSKFLSYQLVTGCRWGRQLQSQMRCGSSDSHRL